MFCTGSFCSSTCTTQQLGGVLWLHGSMGKCGWCCTQHVLANPQLAPHSMSCCMAYLDPQPARHCRKCATWYLLALL
jgi:hypothetical protein